MLVRSPAKAEPGAGEANKQQPAPSNLPLCAHAPGMGEVSAPMFGLAFLSAPPLSTTQLTRQNT